MTVKPVLIAAALTLLALAAPARATPWQADGQEFRVGDRVVSDCTDAADNKRMKGFEREKYIKQCIKDNR